MDTTASKLKTIDALTHVNLILSLSVVLLLNIIDAFFTIIFVDRLGYQEANPIVAPLFTWGPSTFFAWKIVTVFACCAIIYASWTKSKKKWVQKFVNVLMVVYGILALTHVCVMVRLLM